MRLEDLELELRPRRGWQAVDLGFPLVRAHARVLFPAWFLLWGAALLPAAVLLPVAPEYGLLACAFAWWVRPLLERMPLHVLSRAVFGERLTVGRALREWPRLCRDRWVSSLLWGRVSMVRGLVRPVHQLEGLPPAESGRRAALLGKGGTATTAALWHLCCVHFEGFTTLLPLLLAGLFLPSVQELVNPFALLDGAVDGQLLPQYLSLLGYWLAGGLVGPFYVAGCFTLYLNRRAELEAWDLELSLRRMVRRLRPQGLAGLCLALALLSPAALAGTCPAPAWLPPPQARPPALDARQEQLRRRLDSLGGLPELRGWECRETWVPRELEPAADPKVPAWAEALGRWLARAGGAVGRFLEGMAGVVRAGLVLLALLLVGYVLWRFRGSLPRIGARRAWTAGDSPGERSWEWCGEEGWDELRGALEARLRAGQGREALGLLYRLGLLACAPMRPVRGDCEREVLARARALRAAGRLEAATLAWLEAVVGLRTRGTWGGEEVPVEGVRELAQAMPARPSAQEAA